MDISDSWTYCPANQSLSSVTEGEMTTERGGKKGYLDQNYQRVVRHKNESTQLMVTAWLLVNLDTAAGCIDRTPGYQE